MRGEKIPVHEEWWLVTCEFWVSLCPCGGSKDRALHGEESNDLKVGHDRGKMPQGSQKTLALRYKEWRPAV